MKIAIASLTLLFSAVSPTGGESIMRYLAKFLTVVLLLFFVFTAPSKADIKSVKIRSDERSLIVFQEFEFTNTGHVSVNISSVSITSLPFTSNLSRLDPSRIGFYLLSDDAIYYMNAERNSCDLDSKFISLLFTFQDLSPSQSSFNKSYDVTYPNLYTLRFANCNPLSHVTMDVRTEVYNTHNNGTIKDYVSAGQTNIPSLYFNFSLIHTCFLVFWIYICFKNHPSVHSIHLLLGLFLIMKGLNLLCAAKVQLSMKVTGTPPHGWDVLFYVFQFMRTMLFYTATTVIFQVEYAMMFVIPLQVFATVASKMAGLGLFDEMYAWDFGLLMADNVTRIILLVLIGSETCKTPETKQAVENYSAKITVFYNVFIVYSIIDFVLETGSCLDYNYNWANASEIASLAFYMLMFFLFRPLEERDYFAVPAKELEVWNAEFSA